MIFPIVTIAGGLLAASSFIIAKQPNAKQLFDKVAPYQGGFGLGLLGFGLFWLLFRVIPNLGALSHVPFVLVLTASAVVLNILVGFLLGFGLLNKLLLSKSELGQAKGAEALARLVRVQVPLGLTAAGVGVVVLLKLQLNLI